MAIVQQCRYLKAAVRKLLPKAELKRLHDKSMQRIIYVGNSSSSSCESDSESTENQSEMKIEEEHKTPRTDRPFVKQTVNLCNSVENSSR